MTDAEYDVEVAEFERELRRVDVVVAILGGIGLIIGIPYVLFFVLLMI